MTSELVIASSPHGICAGLLRDGRLIEFDLGDRDGLGDIHLGRVRKVAPEIDGAFVDCGLEADALLGARDARALSGARRGTSISRQVTEGQAILVQLKRVAQADKGAKVGSDIALKGVLLVYRPRAKEVELIGELAGSDHAEEQQARGKSLFPEGGFDLRAAAVDADDRELHNEADRLRQRWRVLEHRAAKTDPPARLEPEPDPLHALLLERFSPRLDRIIFAERTTLIRARRWLEQSMPSWLVRNASRLEHLPEAFETTGVAAQLDEALGRTVALEGGGNLIIEPTAALTAIDVNGGGRGPLEVDLEAAREIARQLRLRRLGGIVVVDFVDLPTKAERARVVNELRQALAADPTPTQLYPMSQLGLVELARQRTGPSLDEYLGRLPGEEGSG
ncbi:MAG: ribonuclease E/G [Pseudomonadota bacterium]